MRTSPRYNTENFEQMNHVKCKKCGHDTILVKSTNNGRWFTVDEQPADYNGATIYLWHKCVTNKMGSN